MKELDKPETFMDSKTIIAIIFVMMGVFGWQYYLSKKYPQAHQEQKNTTTETKTAEAAVSPTQTSATTGEMAAPTAPVAAAQSFQAFKFSNYELEMSSVGMGFRNIKLLNYTERDKSQVLIGKDLEILLNETQLNGQAVAFAITETTANSVTGRAMVGSTALEKKIVFHPEKYLAEIKLNVSGPGVVTTVLAANVHEKTSSFLMPAFDFDSFFVQHGGSNERHDIDPTQSQVFKEKLNNVSIASLGGHYFTSILKDKSPIVPELETATLVDKKISIGKLNYVVNAQQATQLEYILYIGPKDADLLAQIDEEFTRVINFGIFSVIAKPILWMLKTIYKFLGNYGVAIILVTLIIRMILLPLNVSSFKSMKKMQEIQPQLKQLKEKFKNNPQQLQIETMNLMKVNKVNPLGGCLPMLMQLPIFIALYNVLAQSIELYQAPFIFWIHDLSLKDPFYVLPVLMGITMYVQQKITPTTMDPAQAKAMQIMPVIFSLLMISLPSGLTLYIFISTLFGITQQYFFMNDKKTKSVKA